MKTADK